MKKLILLLLFIPLVFACGGEKNDPLYFPSLTITNNKSNIGIHTVSLVGYSFENLSINKGESKTFTLSNGIDGGLNNVNVQLTWSCGGKNNWRASKSLNFKDGENTSIDVVTSFVQGEGGCTDVILE